MGFKGKEVAYPEIVTCGRIRFNDGATTVALQMKGKKDHTPVFVLTDKTSIGMGGQLLKLGIKNHFANRRRKSRK